MTNVRMFKYPLKIEDFQVIAVPKGALLRCVQTQGETPCIWAEVDPSAPKVTREIRTYGTGHPMESDWPFYLGTYQVNDGARVFHVYTKLE